MATTSRSCKPLLSPQTGKKKFTSQLFRMCFIICAVFSSTILYMSGLVSSSESHTCTFNDGVARLCALVPATNAFRPDPNTPLLQQQVLLAIYYLKKERKKEKKKKRKKIYYLPIHVGACSVFAC